jgi:transposase InsO family protein
MKKSSKQRKQYTKKSYTYEFRVKCAKLCVEEGYPRKYVSEQGDVSIKTLANWIKKYNESGEAGLKDKPRSKAGRVQVHNEVKDKIIEIKKEYPIFGSRKISDILKRIFFLKASPETVRQTLQKEELIHPPKRKPRKNPQKPRFFERSTPNQMWQTDIFSFRLGGQAAYLIGYIDDYSRYIVGLGLYRKQTAENVLEVYRQAIGETGVPAEMLTDNGRQYTNWRGVSRFEKELKKDRVKHIKSQPHHPMTLGKIERFWKTIWTEFLDRCQFDSLETARERIALWVKYYNHHRPHQGIKGLCPADRYFEIASDLRKVMQKGIEENTLELALRGRSTKPFYMVGRMNGQSVVLQAEKGKVSFSVEGEEKQNQLFEMEKENDSEEKAQPQKIQCGTESASSVITLDGTIIADGTVPDVGNQFINASEMAGSRHAGYVGSTGRGKLKTAGEIAESAFRESTQPSNPEEVEDLSCGSIRRSKHSINGIGESGDGRCGEGNGDDHEGSFRVNDRRACSRGVGNITQNLLREGEQSTHCNVTVIGTGFSGASPESGRSGEGTAEISGKGTADAIDPERTGHSDSQDPLRRDPRRRLF